MSIKIRHIEYYLPEQIITNEDLAKIHPNWDIIKVAEKSGVLKRHIAKESETAYDLACQAVKKLFLNTNIQKEEIDGIVFCTQSPDYVMPSNAFLIHKEFDFDKKVWAFDYNLACSGYVYGLAIVRGMISSKMAKSVLLINADTYSKFIGTNDRSTSVLFGDGAAVSLITQDTAEDKFDIVLETSGKEFDSFYIPAGGCRMPKSEQTKLIHADKSGNQRTLEDIHMNGFAVWKFISTTVPIQINSLLAKNQMDIDDIDLFVFHQASMLTLNSLIKVLRIAPDKTFFNLDKIGNTVSASIPIALKDADISGKLKRGDTVLLSGFGVGLSWGSLIIKY